MKIHHILAASALALSIVAGGVGPAVAAAPVASPTAKMVVEAAAKKKTVTKYATSNVHLRAKAGTKHKSLQVIKKGARVTVLKTSGGWSQVKVGKKTGWTSAKYLTTKAPGNKSTVKKVVKKKAPVKKKLTKNQVFTNKARVIINRHGCKSAKIKLNDKRLGRYSNGVADWYNNTILLRSSMPAYRLNYVASHECMHLRQYKAYGGNVNALSKAMNKIYGGKGFTGLERNADCMTRAVGIKVTNSAYSSSCKGAKSNAAKRVLAGKRA